MPKMIFIRQEVAIGVFLIVLQLLRLSVAQPDDDGTILQSLNDTKLDNLLNLESFPLEDHYEHPRCQTMNIPFCENVDYNKTMLPNFFGHQTQQDVINEINVYHYFSRVNCSPDLKLFLCTAYAPMCFDQVNGSKPIYLFPCRSLCESVQQGCSNQMLKRFDSEWPHVLQCDKFPDKKDKGVICVGKDDEPRFSHNGMEMNDIMGTFSSAITRDFVCPKNFEVKSYTLHINGKNYDNCAMPCDDVLLDNNSAEIVRLIAGIVAIVCLVSTVFTCTTFFIDTKRFKYPARPIIIISFCQLVVASCYLLGFLTYNKIACNDPAEPPKNLPNLKMIRTVTMGNRKGYCTLQFMALYFFHTSTLTWFLMMSISLYMIAGLKWAPEAVSGVSRYFHLFSWTSSALMTIYLSVLGDIEGDPLTGVCYVSTSDQQSIWAFVKLPIYICLGASMLFLGLGFKSLLATRETIKREYGKQADEHDKLLFRIGTYILLFVTFAVTLLLCHEHEQKNRDSWMLHWLSNICTNRDYSIPCPVRNLDSRGPNYLSFTLKYVATMGIGITSALFMMSAKTMTSYREVAELCNYKFRV